jgi:uncharacterized protein YdeI (YjbR/CyaY-like superfamily)
MRGTLRGMARAPEDSVHPADRAEWRKWLADHHAASPGVWLLTWRKASGKEALRYEEAVEEALCFGWIDSKVRSLDDHRTMQWYTARRRGSVWSRSNKERIARLAAQGLMTSAGLAAIEAAKADGSWSVLDEVEAEVIPDDLAAALDEQPPARQEFDAFPPSARKAVLFWLVSAKRPETRARRVREAAEKAQRGERANQPQPRPPT